MGIIFSRTTPTYPLFQGHTLYIRETSLVYMRDVPRIVEDAIRRLYARYSPRMEQHIHIFLCGPVRG